jgi:hypothetical protein
MRTREASRPDGPALAAVCNDRRILRDCGSFSDGMAMGVRWVLLLRSPLLPYFLFSIFASTLLRRFCRPHRRRNFRRLSSSNIIEHALGCHFRSVHA